MPVRMTDLLDGWEDGSVELPPPAGMSPERIKERTMEQIRHCLLYTSDAADE